MGFILWLIIGGIAGWIAGKVMRGGGFGILGNIVVGIVGAVIGGFLFSLLGLSSNGLIGSLVVATIGAIILLWIVANFPFGMGVPEFLQGSIQTLQKGFRVQRRQEYRPAA